MSERVFSRGPSSRGLSPRLVPRRLTAAAAAARGERRISWVILAAILSQLTVSANLLQVSGIPYDIPGGLPPEKFHVGTYLAALAVLLQARRRRPAGPAFAARIAAAPLFPLAFALMLVCALFALLSTGMSGSAVYVESYASAALLGFALELQDRAALRRIAYAMLAAFVGNALLCIGETVAQHLVVPVLLADPYGYVHELPMASGEFRGTGLYEHPLVGATMTMMGVLLCLASDLRPLLKGACLAALLVGLIAFGGRTALLVGYALAAGLGVRAVGSRLLRRRMDGRGLAATLAALVLAPAVLGAVLFATSLGARISGKLYLDDSAAVRLVQWRVLGQMRLHDWLYGMDPERLSDALFAIGLQPPWNDIENFWLLVFVSLGAVGTAFWLAGLGALLWRLWRGAGLLARLTLLGLLLVASSSNSLGRKSNLLFIGVAATMSMAAFAPRPPPASNPRTPEIA